jgi:hypothetical protein
MFTRTEIETQAERLFSLTNQPAPRLRLLRDVLGTAHDPRLDEARARLMNSSAVVELRHAQQPNGTWGRFHSQDSSRRLPFSTTEFAIKRVLGLGLDGGSEILCRAVDYMQGVLAGQVTWSDPPEKHEGWPANIQFITAGVLASIDPRHPALAPHARTWAEIVRRTFHGGQYDPSAERQAHRDLNGIVTKGKYLKLAGLYPLRLLALPCSGLEAGVEQALLHWLWTKADGIYYTYGAAMGRMPPLDSPHFIFWLEGQSLLSGFAGWRALAEPLLERLWAARGPDGLWDFGPHARASAAMPLSENWKNPLDRKIDCSVYALMLVSKLQNRRTISD